MTHAATAPPPTELGGSSDKAAVDPTAWAAEPPRGLRRYLPILEWLPAYERRSLRFDLIAGVTIWGLLVPEMIAYAGLAGLPPQAGLYTLLVSLAAYAIFGTSRDLAVAGTSASAVLVASTVTGLSPANAEAYAADAAALVLFCGGLFVIAGLLRLGFIAQFLSRPCPCLSGRKWKHCRGSPESTSSEGGAMWWGIGIGGGVLYVILLITLGVMTLSKGHGWMFFFGIFFPLFWVIGAFVRPSPELA